jgi:putative hydrolase of the HAD superfamily
MNLDPIEPVRMSEGDGGGESGVLDANALPKLRPVEPSALASVQAQVPDLRHVEAIYFDLDDTLCAYWEASKQGLRRAFDAHGPDGYSTQEMVQHWAAAFREFSPTLKQTGWYEGYLKSGEPTRTEQMRLTLLRLGVVDTALADQLSQAYMEFRNQGLRLFDEVPEVLEALHGRYPLGLVTNGPADIQRQEIATLGIERYFDHVFIEGEVGEGKPLPSVFRRAAKQVEKEADRLLFVGNSYAHDVRPAVESGWHAVWVRRPSDVPPSAGPGLAKPEEMPEGAPAPDAIVQDLREILPMLGIQAGLPPV